MTHPSFSEKAEVCLHRCTNEWLCSQLKRKFKKQTFVVRQSGGKIRHVNNQVLSSELTEQVKLGKMVNTNKQNLKKKKTSAD